MLSLPSPLRIANAAAVLHGPHGAVSQQARHLGLSRQALYRDTQAVLHTLDGHDARQQLQQCHAQVAALQQRITALQDHCADAFHVDDDRVAAFASMAQAEGVSLPLCRRLLAVLLAQPVANQPTRQRQPPSVAHLGRLSQQASRRSAALLAVLDEMSRSGVQQAAADEIFFGNKPCLMVIEPASLCWVSGRLSDRRNGAEWAKEFRQLPNLRQVTQDGGTGLANGLTQVNHERQQAGQAAVLTQDDHFHVLREGTRVLRKMQGHVRRCLEQAEQADRKAQRKERRTGDGRVRVAARKVWRRAEQAYDAWTAADKTWQEVEQALRLFTAQGALNSRAQAQAVLQAAVGQLSGPPWAKVRRQLQRPQLLTFLDQAQQALSSVPAAPELVAAAVHVQGLRRQPQALRGAEVSAGVMRGMLLAAGLVLSLSGQAGQQATTLVGAALRGVWRASSLVECINSVARMHQGRHRKMTQGLLDLKRLYWNCRRFRTGHRRQQSPYELQGLCLPTSDWWQLLKLTPEQLRQQLQGANGMLPQPSQDVSGPTVAA